MPKNSKTSDVAAELIDAYNNADAVVLFFDKSPREVRLAESGIMIYKGKKKYVMTALEFVKIVGVTPQQLRPAFVGFQLGLLPEIPEEVTAYEELKYFEYHNRNLFGLAQALGKKVHVAVANYEKKFVYWGTYCPDGTEVMDKKLWKQRSPYSDFFK